MSWPVLFINNFFIVCTHFLLAVSFCLVSHVGGAGQTLHLFNDWLFTCHLLHAPLSIDKSGCLWASGRKSSPEAEDRSIIVWGARRWVTGVSYIRRILFTYFWHEDTILLRAKFSLSRHLLFLPSSPHLWSLQGFWGLLWVKEVH